LIQSDPWKRPWPWFWVKLGRQTGLGIVRRCLEMDLLAYIQWFQSNSRSLLPRHCLVQ
jgi:hypothetical protein